MLRFKQFISEANISHFSHLGLDPSNPEHKDMVDAYNNGLNAKENRVTTKPNQIKTFDQLKSTVAPHIAAIQQKRKEDAEDQEAFKNKDAELVHHDPETGVKVFKVRSGKGCAATGGDTKWCVAHRETGNAAMRAYDTSGENSYVIHTPEKGNLSKIGIIGVKPGKPHNDGAGGNFQDKGNNTVSDEHWDMLRKKYNLDNVKALHGIRGLKNPEVEHLLKNASSATKDPNTSAEDLETIAKHRDDPEVHKAIANHKNAGDNALTHVAEKTYDPEVHRAIAKHENAGDNALAEVGRKSDEEAVHETILKHKNAGDKALTILAGDLGGDDFDGQRYRNVKPEMLRAILKHKNVGDNALAAVANSLPSEVLAHPKAGDAALASVAHNDYDPKTHMAILKHPKANKLALDAVAERADYDPDIYRAIMDHKHVGENALYHIASNSNDPEVHAAILKHAKVGDGALGEIARDSDDPEVHRAIMDHKHVGDYALGQVAEKSDDPEVHRVIAKHKNAEDYTLSTVVKKSNDPEIHRLIANHENAGEYSRKNLARAYNTSPDKESITRAIDDHIRSKKNNPYQLESFLSAYRRVIR